jgi:hypothetical protein
MTWCLLYHRGIQCSGPDDVSLASCPTAVMRCHTAGTAVIIRRREFIGARGAFLERLVAVPL